MSTLRLTPRRLAYLRKAADVYRFQGGVSRDWYLNNSGRWWKVTAEVTKMIDAGWVEPGAISRRDGHTVQHLARTGTGAALVAKHTTVERATPAGGVL